MKITPYVLMVYAILLIIGGVIGYIKAGSIVSLVMGIAFGISLIVSSIGMFKKCVHARYTSLILTGFLTLFFIYRFIMSYKMMPSGVMAIISIIVLGILASKPIDPLTKE